VGIVVLLAGTLLGLGAGSLLGDDPPVRASNPGTEAALPTAPPTSSTVAPTTTTTVPEATTPPPGEGASSGQTVPEASGGSQEPGGSGSTSTTTPATTTTTPAGGTGETLTWPSGESGYTAVLASVTDRAAAEAAARRAREAGISAGVLSSDDYGSLRAGYWVAFGGRFSSAEEAEEAAAGYRGQGFPDAYPRQVRP
jgi:hypothetical protein